MRQLLLLCLLFLCPMLCAQPCTDCDIIRGDVNCDGSVNIADYIAMNQYAWSNNDAADINDNGVVNNSDTVALADYLFNGGAAPACPFPSEGHDCTPDNLEKCCSPPTGRISGEIPEVMATGSWEVFVNDPWDSRDNTAENVGTRKGRKFTAQNYSTCDHDFSKLKAQMAVVPDDTTGFTRKRLENGIQSAELFLDIIPIKFQCGDVCDAYSCVGWNQLSVTGAKVEVLCAPVSGGAPKSFTKTVNFEKVYRYVRKHYLEGCGLEKDDDPEVEFTEIFDITEDLAALTVGDCDVWEVTGITVTDVFLYYKRDGYPDIATTEKIEVTMYSWVSYSWCTCP